MSDVPQGEGWWQASDGKWYPPDTASAAPAAASEQPLAASVPPGPEQPASVPPGPAGAPPHPGWWQASDGQWYPPEQAPGAAAPAAYGAPGYPQPGYPGAAPFDPLAKQKMVAGLLGIFLGGFGVHNFYLGYTNKGIIQIVVTVLTCGLGALWGTIEGVLILVGHESFRTDATGRPLRD